MPTVHQAAVVSTLASVPVLLLPKNVMEAADLVMEHPTTERPRPSAMVNLPPPPLATLATLAILETLETLETPEILATPETLAALEATSIPVSQALRMLVKAMLHSSSLASASVMPTVPRVAVDSTLASALVQ